MALFERLMVLLIVANMFTMGMRSAHDDFERQKALESANIAMCLCFVCELCVKLAGMGLIR